MSGIKFIMALVWPFVKEMILGGKTLMESIKDNKKRVFFALLVMGSFIYNAYITGRIIAISREHVVLQEKYDRAIAGSRQNPIHDGVEVKQNKEPKPVVVVEPPVAAKEEDVPKAPMPTVKVVKRRETQAEKEAAERRFHLLQKNFQAIRDREAAREEEQKTQ